MTEAGALHREVIRQLAEQLHGIVLGADKVGFSDYSGRRVVATVPVDMVRGLADLRDEVSAMFHEPLPVGMASLLAVYAQEVEPSPTEYPTKYRLQGMPFRFVVKPW